MPLSAAFHFFSPFLYEKKYHYTTLLFNSFLSSLLFRFPVNSLSAPIFVILLNTIKK